MVAIHMQKFLKDSEPPIYVCVETTGLDVKFAITPLDLLEDNPKIMWGYFVLYFIDLRGMWSSITTFSWRSQ